MPIPLTLVDEFNIRLKAILAWPFFISASDVIYDLVNTLVACSGGDSSVIATLIGNHSKLHVSAGNPK